MINSSQSTLQALINHKKPKYAILENLFDSKMEGINQVQLFIDLDFVISSYFNPQIDLETFRNIVSGEDSLIGEILNYVAHFRHFFYKVYGCYSRIILFHSSQIEDVKQLNPEYKNEIYAKRGVDFAGYDSLGKTRLDKDDITERKEFLLKSILGRLTKILYFVPSVYIIDSKEMKPDNIPRLLLNSLDENTDVNLNVIISNYTHMVQYVYFDKTVFLENKADHSKLYDQNNFYHLFSSTPKTLDELSSLKIESLSTLFGLAGFTKYSVSGVGKYKLVNSAKALIKTPDLIDKLTEEEKSKFEINLKCLSILEDFEYPSDIKITLLKSQLVDFVDNDGLKKYINRYCPSYAVNFIWLTEGEV